jgi:hypothetical protein
MSPDLPPSEQILTAPRGVVPLVALAVYFALACMLLSDTRGARAVAACVMRGVRRVRLL